MYLHLETLRKALRTALLRRPFVLRRWVIVLGFTLLFLVFWSFLGLGRLLDHLFFAGWRRQPVEAPVFIVATPRSGTTFMQRLLSLDSARFKPLLMYEMIF
ncbi:MAG: sulfotransferase, partial [Acetobacteraceae bacterium]|nr:sulfotransferase [Acetobacteraceae bacterium]